MANIAFQPITGFMGINNRIDPVALGWLWQLIANNVVLDDAKRFVRRPGYSAFFANVADVFGTLDDRLFVITTSQNLYEVFSDGSYWLRATGFSGAPFQWAELGTAAFAISETAKWVIYPDRVVPWGIPTLDAPMLSLTTGSLQPGNYLASVVLVAPDGRMGGSMGVSAVRLTAESGIVALSEPVVGYTTKLFLSKPDANLLYDAGDFSTSTLTITTQPGKSIQLHTQNIYPPPPGGMVISRHGNRIAVATWEPQYGRSVLYWSKPEAPHWFDYEADHQLIEGKPTLMAAHGGMLLVATDRVIYQADAVGNAQAIMRIGALPDTRSFIDSGQVVFWTDLGPAIWPEFQLMTEKSLLPDNRTLSTSGILDYQGSRYLITTMRGQIRPKAQRNSYSPLAVTIDT